MYYEVWKDAEGNQHFIKNMPTQYIENCINQIERICFPALLKSGKYDDYPEKEYAVLSPEWCEHCANGYLKAFKEEIKKRNEVRYEG